MNETFWGLYESQISALRNCSSPEESNTIMLETAKYLVEHIDLTDTTMEQYDKFGMRKLFAAHNALGSAVTAFYEAERDRLDPAARNGAIGQKLSLVSEQITSTTEAFQMLQESEKTLFAKENELLALEKELEFWKQKAARLQDTEANAAAEIQRYKEQFEKLDATIKSYRDDIAFWEAHLGEDCAILSKMKAYGVESLDSLLSSIDKLESNIKQDLKALDAVIMKVVDQEAQVREAVLRKQNKMV